MRIALGFALLLAACGSKGKAAPATPPGTNGSGTELSAGQHEGEPDNLTPEMRKFHDLLAPLWHAAKGPERIKATCAAIGELQANADAIATATPPTTANADKWTEGTRALIAGVTGLADACKSNDAAKFETAFEKVHNAFHSLMAQGGMHHAERPAADAGSAAGSATGSAHEHQH